MAVRMAAGLADFWTAQLDPEGEPSAMVVEGYRQAALDLGRMSAEATRAGVAERAVRIAGRTAERLALAAEEALEGLGIEPAARQRFIDVFSGALARLEDEDVIEGTATDL